MAKNKKEYLGLTKVLQKIAYRHHFSNVFDDFLTMAVCAFSYGKMEELYFNVSKKYNSEELNLFSQAVAEMFIEYENYMNDEGSWKDILGNVFEECNSSFTASSNGQFFTPDSVCNLMANLVGDNNECAEGIVVNDCSSGSSRNLIAHSRLNAKNRINAFYVAQDLDERCINMSVLNFIMFGMKGIVIHMNTLTMEVFKGYRIWLPETMIGITPLNKQECLNYLSDTDNCNKIELGKQTSLF